MWKKMALFEGVLMEEYERSLRITDAVEEAIADLPRGYVRERTRAGHTYYYHQFTEDGHVRCVYVPREEADELRDRIELRRSYAKGLKIQKKSRTQITRALGRRFIEAHLSDYTQTSY